MTFVCFTRKLYCYAGWIARGLKYRSNLCYIEWRIYVQSPSSGICCQLIL
jgi:hypothetical protein